MGDDKKRKVVMPPAEIEKLKNSSTGQPIPLPYRHMLEVELKTDLSEIRIHTSNEAVKATNLLGVSSFSSGNHVFFNTVAFQVKVEGKDLLVRELLNINQKNQDQ